MSTSSKLKISKEALSDFFEIDSIREGKSLKTLISLKGTEGLCDSLQSSASKGISSDSLLTRQDLYGKNEGYTRDRKKISRIIWEALQDTVLQILILSSIVSLIIGLWQDPSTGWIEGAVILIAVLIVLTVTATNDYIKDGQFLKLNKSTNTHTVTVTRDAKEQEIPASDLLVGDLMHVSPGEVLNVDGVLVKSTKLKVDESQITGESSTVLKEAVKGLEVNCDPFLLSGSKVLEGYGAMVVCGVGMNSINEKLRQISGLDNEEQETPLQERLGKLALLLGKFGLVAGIVLSSTLLIYTVIEAATRNSWTASSTSEAISALILGITVLVVAIPEGLPLALTLSMAYSVIQMKKESIFVRHISGCEIMGAATKVLTDKTGTLTENKMKVVSGCLFSEEFEDLQSLNLKPDQIKVLSKVISRNTTAFYKTVSGKQEISGSKTEGALIDWICQFGEDIYRYRDPEQELLKYCFTSETKKMTTVYNNYDNGFEVYCKGAAEVMLDLCTHHIQHNGNAVLIDSFSKEIYSKKIQEMTRKKLRVLGIAFRLSNEKFKQSFSREELEQDLVLIGLLAIQDRLRPEAKATVEGVQKAGITVIMVTGDNKETASSIALASGILPDEVTSKELENFIMTGREFREKSGGLVQSRNSQGNLVDFRLVNRAAFQEAVRCLRVIVRCTPEDKLLLTIGLKELGEVVAVTGDGSNDSAALKQSDIGIAMMSGTQLAKESSDIILLNDNFTSVLNSVKWGRNVYANTRKFLQFQMTVNIVALLMSILGGITISESPINAVQMLWVNLIMDSLAALALATEPPNDTLLDSVPFGRTENIITYDMVVIILGQCFYQTTVLLVVLYLGPGIFKIEKSWGNESWNENNGKHFTIFFNCFVMLQLFNEINCRKCSLSQVNVFSNFCNNWMFHFIFVSTFFVQILLVQCGGRYLKSVRLSLGEHLVCISVGASGLVFGVLVRAVVTMHRSRLFYKLYNKGEHEERFNLINGVNYEGIQ